MKKFLRSKWTIPIATLVLTLSIGTAAFAASSTDATSTAASDSSTALTSNSSTSSDSASATASTDSDSTGGQRGDETLLTGTTADQVTAAALAEVGSDATVQRVETDADGNAAYEAHVTKADGTCVTVYVDESFNVVSVEEGQAGGGHHGMDNDADDSDSNDSSSDSSTSTSGS